ncbi:MAG: hypothetical protein EXS31_04555 [Pedosphaera sp.]|nr:hypothetical protein [Pedosphaera sp.]
MLNTQRIGSVTSYVTSGLACGLGGMLLMGIPGAVLSGGLKLGRDYLIRKGVQELDPYFWLPATITSSLPPATQIFWILGPLAFGFAFGWWAGMHNPHNFTRTSRRAPSRHVDESAGAVRP